VDELDKEFELKIRVASPDGQTDELATVSFTRGTTTAEVAAPKYQIIPLNVAVNFRVVGEHSFLVVSGDEVLATVPLGVRYNPQQTLEVVPGGEGQST
jgi:hypothetical protein